MEKIFICQQCHAELGEDEVDGILGHAVPDYDEDGDVDGCNQCGPCEMNRDWALARIKSLKDCAAKMQERNVALQSEHLNHVNALHEQLTAMTAERDSESRWAKHYSDKVTELEQQLAAMQRIIDSYLDSYRR